MLGINMAREHGSMAVESHHTRWRKSSYSNAGGECVEVASLSGTRLVRDSKQANADRLAFSSTAWNAFLGAVKAGEFDV
ncbi:DUF397 domain-containing protein [Marinactinospora rubrisoli]|uniref:DUF397 domain-containing protein n=1 Tax=Marinactinospora rubrisoli TaxID=2715399 RepID=A0ABW2KI16_9ACTN